MRVDNTTAGQLGWNEVLSFLAEEALTEQGRRACLALEPSADADPIRISQERCRQLGRLIDEGRPPPLEAVEDLSEELDRAVKHGSLTGEAVRRVARAMRVSSRLRRYLMNQGHEAGGALTELARGTHDLSTLGDELLQAFDESGQLRDSASPELGPLRRTARSAADGIRTRLERLMRKPKVAACLTDSYITQRSDRYVLPVRADAHERLAGIVHDTSQTGATLFVEPAEMVEEGNRLKIAQAAVAEQERRILAEYTLEIAGCSQDLADNLACLAEFDRLRATVMLGRRMGAAFIDAGGKGIDLIEARHPLMLLHGNPVVANHIRISPQQRCLIVTGPNAGGKTVTLKTVGLLALMAQSGLAVPAGEGSRIGMFESLHAVIGDAQDLRRGLSTFSAHVTSLSSILEQAGENTLVLLDEIVADTDPRHGAALATSVLRALTERGATTVVTTHFDELKRLAYDDQRFANASVGFDLESMEPTYALHPDVPGRSLTLDIARRLGIAEEILAVAAERMDGSERQVENMLASLDQERQAMNRLREELGSQLGEARRQAGEHARAAEELSDRKEKLLGEGRAEMLAEIRKVRREVAAMIETLRQNPSMKTAVTTSQKLKEAEARLLEQTNSEPGPGEGSVMELQVGDRVRVATWDKEGQVTALDTRAGMVSVQFGTRKTRLPVEQLTRVATRPPRRQGRAPRKKTLDQHPPRSGVEVRTPANTIDLRGKHVEEALDELDKRLDELFAAEQDVAFVIHGHGTGALKAAVREYLRDSAYPNHFRSGTPEEGGDGITVIKMK